MTSALVLCSGGVDSTTLAHLCKKRRHFEVQLLAINYGQRHSKELSFAENIAYILGTSYSELDLSDLGWRLSSSLTDDSADIPDGHYADKVMTLTVVPNRNAIFINVAAAIAVSRGLDIVATAVHAGDHPIYKDCRPKFVHTMQRALNESLDNPVLLLTPFLSFTKADIVELGAQLGVPYEQTWSCYKGQDYHCGVCGTCVERREAFKIAGVQDPTFYKEYPE